ncbi:MAG: hypothetical protein ACTSPB_24740, partial [Candidatus Thorarchaeota archaeon]
EYLLGGREVSEEDIKKYQPNEIQIKKTISGKDVKWLKAGWVELRETKSFNATIETDFVKDMTVDRRVINSLINQFSPTKSYQLHAN